MSLIRWRTVGHDDGDDDDGDRPTLEAVLDHYDVRIPSSGRGMTNCPLHEDRTPSLSVNTDHGVWRCHSCGEGGDSYALLMKKEGVTFRNAVLLAADLNLGTGVKRESSSDATAYIRGRPVVRRGGKSGGSYVPAWRRR